MKMQFFYLAPVLLFLGLILTIVLIGGLSYVRLQSKEIESLRKRADYLQSVVDKYQSVLGQSETTAGYQLQKGIISEDEVQLPNVAEAEHAYYKGILMACAEEQTNYKCKEAEDYAKQYNLKLE